MFTNKTLLITGGTGSFGNAVLKKFLDTDLKELISKDKSAEAIELFMNLTGESLEEAKRHINSLSKLL